MTPEPLPPAAQPERLTAALRRSEALREGHVSNVTIESSRNTILSKIIRLNLVYDGAPAGAPGSLVLKTGLPERADPRWGSGRREVAFYTEVAARMSLQLVPRCFDAAWDAETNAWHLLLEDLADSHFTIPSWPLPPTLDQSKQIIAGRARFQAQWWDDPRLGELIGTWLEQDDRRLQAFAEQVARFGDRLGDRLSTARRDFYQRLIDSGQRLSRRYHSHHNMTIVQGDAHVWNAFLPRDAGSDLRLFDWDAWRVDVATDDLACMMALHWFPEHRRRDEQPLLDHYHQELLAHGVRGYDRRALHDDYLLSVLWQAATPVWQADNNIPAWIWWNHLERIFMAIDDLGCRELLDM